jgi:dTMP kinase
MRTKRRARKGAFIVIDGIDGSGKSTELRYLKKELRGRSALFTHEPGGTPHAEAIRKALLTHRAGKRDVLSDFFLFLAARAVHVREAVQPALAKGKIVITDRFDSSTFAFQIVAESRKDLADAFWTSRETLLGGQVPDAYIILDLPPELAMKRRRTDTSKRLTSFDTQELAYHRRVRAGFKAFRPVGSKVFVVDASRSPEEVHADVWRIVQRFVK